MESYEHELENEQMYIEKHIGFAQDNAESCSIENITISNNLVDIKPVHLGINYTDDGYDMGF